MRPLIARLGVESHKTKNWSAEYLKLTEQADKKQSEAIAESDSARIPDAPASHPFKDYAGIYAAPGYADFHIKWEDNKLWGFYAGEWFRLNHYHYDIFDLDRLESYGDTIKLSFMINTAGFITALNFPVEPEVGDTQFTRSSEGQVEQ